jgi:hypothetical protein
MVTRRRVVAGSIGGLLLSSLSAPSALQSLIKNLSLNCRASGR